MDMPKRLIRHLTDEEAARTIALIEDGRRYFAGVIGFLQRTISRVGYRGQLSGQGYLRLMELRIKHTIARSTYL